MYSYIKGVITEVTPNYITVENNEIGYLIKVPNPYQFQEGKKNTVYLYHHVREDAIILYGFKTLKERDAFILLISVKGLGPKGALAILASATPEEIAYALNDNNAKFFSGFPGIGQKLSQQIILDLKGKINFDDSTKVNPKNELLDKVTSALKALGYSSQEIKAATKDLEIDNNTSVSEAVKIALKRLKKN